MTYQHQHYARTICSDELSTEFARFVKKKCSVIGASVAGHSGQEKSAWGEAKERWIEMFCRKRLRSTLDRFIDVKLRNLFIRKSLRSLRIWSESAELVVPYGQAPERTRRLNS